MSSAGAKAGVISISVREREEIREAKKKFFNFLFSKFEDNFKGRSAFFHKSADLFFLDGELRNTTSYKKVWLRILTDKFFYDLGNDVVQVIKNKSPFKGKIILFGDNLIDKNDLVFFGQRKIVSHCEECGLKNGNYTAHVVIIPEPEEVEVYEL